MPEIQEGEDLAQGTVSETAEVVASEEVTAPVAAVEAKEDDFKLQEVPENERIPLKEKIFYGMGAMMDGGGVALMSCVMLSYMTDSLGIYAASASTVMMVSKIWDAITDPVMGHISDNTRSKYGRRKPYMVVGGIMLVIALLLLFAPIKEWGVSGQAGLVAYVLFFYIVWNTCSTITQVPYTSARSLSERYHRRVRILDSYGSCVRYDVRRRSDNDRSLYQRTYQTPGGRS